MDRFLRVMIAFRSCHFPRIEEMEEEEEEEEVTTGIDNEAPQNYCKARNCG